MTAETPTSSLWQPGPSVPRGSPWDGDLAARASMTARLSQPTITSEVLMCPFCQTRSTRAEMEHHIRFHLGCKPIVCVYDGCGEEFVHFEFFAGHCLDRGHLPMKYERRAMDELEQLCGVCFAYCVEAAQPDSLAVRSLESRLLGQLAASGLLRRLALPFHSLIAQGRCGLCGEVRPWSVRGCAEHVCEHLRRDGLRPLYRCAACPFSCSFRALALAHASRTGHPFSCSKHLLSKYFGVQWQEAFPSQPVPKLAEALQSTRAAPDAPTRMRMPSDADSGSFAPGAGSALKSEMHSSAPAAVIPDELNLRCHDVAVVGTLSEPESPVQAGGRKRRWGGQAECLLCWEAVPAEERAEHVWRVHMCGVIVCRSCGAQMQSSAAVLRHIRTVHGGNAQIQDNRHALGPLFDHTFARCFAADPAPHTSGVGSSCSQSSIAEAPNSVDEMAGPSSKWTKTLASLGNSPGSVSSLEAARKDRTLRRAFEVPAEERCTLAESVWREDRGSVTPSSEGNDCDDELVLPDSASSSDRVEKGGQEQNCSRNNVSSTKRSPSSSLQNGVSRSSEVKGLSRAKRAVTHACLKCGADVLYWQVFRHCITHVHTDVMPVFKCLHCRDTAFAKRAAADAHLKQRHCVAAADADSHLENNYAAAKRLAMKMLLQWFPDVRRQKTAVPDAARRKRKAANAAIWKRTKSWTKRRHVHASKPSRKDCGKKAKLELRKELGSNSANPRWSTGSSVSAGGSGKNSADMRAELECAMCGECVMPDVGHKGRFLMPLRAHARTHAASARLLRCPRCRSYDGQRFSCLDRSSLADHLNDHAPPVCDHPTPQPEPANLAYSDDLRHLIAVCFAKSLASSAHPFACDFVQCALCQKIVRAAAKARHLKRHASQCERAERKGSIPERCFGKSRLVTSSPKAQGSSSLLFQDRSATAEPVVRELVCAVCKEVVSTADKDVECSSLKALLDHALQHADDVECYECPLCTFKPVSCLVEDSLRVHLTRDHAVPSDSVAVPAPGFKNRRLAARDHAAYVCFGDAIRADSFWSAKYKLCQYCQVICTMEKFHISFHYKRSEPYLSCELCQAKRSLCPKHDSEEIVAHFRAICFPGLGNYSSTEDTSGLGSTLSESWLEASSGSTSVGLADDSIRWNGARANCSLANDMATTASAPANPRRRSSTASYPVLSLQCAICREDVPRSVDERGKRVMQKTSLLEHAKGHEGSEVKVYECFLCRRSVGSEPAFTCLEAVAMQRHAKEDHGRASAAGPPVAYDVRKRDHVEKMAYRCFAEAVRGIGPSGRRGVPRMGVCEFCQCVCPASARTSHAKRHVNACEPFRSCRGCTANRGFNSFHAVGGCPEHAQLKRDKMTYFSTPWQGQLRGVADDGLEAERSEGGESPAQGGEGLRAGSATDETDSDVEFLGEVQQATPSVLLQAKSEVHDASVARAEGEAEFC